jgi:acyl-CoA dehydrogenase
MAQAANAKLASGEGDVARMTAKLATARFFMEHMLPDTATHVARIKAGAASLIEFPAEAF